MSEEMNLYKRCKNIFKFHGVDIGGGGESAPEVENAIETHGLGWTDTEEKAGFDIQWDGNTEGLETIPVSDGMGLYKVSDVLDIMNPIDNLIGTNIIFSAGEPITVIEEDMLIYEDDKVFGLGEGSFVIIALEDGHMGDSDISISKGVWFVYSPGYSFYVTRLYKEATTEEVVHQIDQKYIPGGSGGSVMYVDVAINDSTGEATSDTTLFDIQTAFNSGVRIMAKVDIGGYNMFVPLIAYTESAQAVPFQALFGGYAYNADEESNAPLLEAQLDMDGDTNWTLSSF